MPTNKPPLKASDASGLVDELQATDQLLGLRLGEANASQRNKRFSLQKLADYVRGNIYPVETSEGIQDATDAGRQMLTATDAAAQLTLVDKFSLAGDASIGRPDFTRAYQTGGALLWLIEKVSLLLSQAAPAAPGTLPVVTGFLPHKGSEDTSVTLTGTNFTGAISVAFNGTPASFQVINATTIQAVVPTGATTGPVSVSTALGTGTSAASFTVGTTVTPTPVNHLPTASAGSDATIQLPTSNAALMGTAADPDSGDTLTYAWRQITGPNAATGMPATTLNVVVSNLVAGTYQFGFTATDQHGAASGEDYVVVTVQAAADTGGGSTSTKVTFTKYSANAPMLSDGAGNGPDWSSFSSGNVTHNAPSGTVVRLTYYQTPGFTTANQGCVTPTGAGLFASGSYLGIAPSPTQEGLSTQDFTLSDGGSGTRSLRIRNSYQQEPNGAGVRYGTKVVAIEFLAAGVTASELTVADKPYLSVIVGDSTTNDVQSSDPHRYGMAITLESSRSEYTFIVLGAGGKRISTTIETAAKQQALAQLLANLYGSATNPVLQLGQVGFNDWNNTQVASSTLAGYRAALFTKTKALVSALKVLNVSMTITGDETGARANDETADSYRTGQESARSGLEDYVFNVDGKSLAPDSDRYDIIHLKTYVNLATNLSPSYNFGTTQAQLAQPVLLHSFSPDTTPGRIVDQGGGGYDAVQSDAAKQPALVQVGAFGQQSLLFKRDGALRYLEVPPTATQAGAFTLIEAYRTVSSDLAQFTSDSAHGRKATIAGGVDNGQGGLNPVSYYDSPDDQNGQGFQGTLTPVGTDVVVAHAFGTDTTVKVLNGVETDNLPKSVTSLKSILRIGAAIDNTGFSPAGGQAFLLHLATELWPGKLTATQIEARRQVIIKGAQAYAALQTTEESQFATTGTWTQATGQGGPNDGTVLYSTHATDTISRTIHGQYFEYYAGKGSGVINWSITRVSDGVTVFNKDIDNTKLTSQVQRADFYDTGFPDDYHHTFTIVSGAGNLDAVRSR